MDNIIEPTIEYDFTKLQLGIPVSHPNSTYVTRLFMNNKPIYMQTPKCTTKAGFITSGKKTYCDLMFSSDDSIFIDWVTNLEKRCHELICSKSDSWFQTTYTNEDIESAFVSPLKIYRSGKYYLLRVNVKPVMKIYNDLNAEIAHGDINETTNMITIIEFYGIKFTSRNFQLEVELKQSMVVSPDEFLGNCFIKTKKPEIELKISEIPNKPIESIDEPFVKVKEAESFVEPIESPFESNEPPFEPIDEPIVKEAESNESFEPTEPPEPEHESNEIIGLVPTNSLELSEFDFDIAERLEESEPLQLKRPTDQYYNEYNVLITRANKLKSELRRIYLEARFIKEKHSLNVVDMDENMDSDIDISDNEDDNV